MAYPIALLSKRRLFIAALTTEKGSTGNDKPERIKAIAPVNRPELFTKVFLFNLLI